MEGCIQKKKKKEVRREVKTIRTEKYAEKIKRSKYARRKEEKERKWNSTEKVLRRRRDSFPDANLKFLSLYL